MLEIGSVVERFSESGQEGQHYGWIGAGSF